MLYFFRSLIDFDWIECHLISSRVGSGRVRIGSGQFDFLKKSNRVGSGSGRISLTFLKNRVRSDSDPNGSDGFLRSGRVLPPLFASHQLVSPNQPPFPYCHRRIHTKEVVNVLFMQPHVLDRFQHCCAWGHLHDQRESGGGRCKKDGEGRVS
jgi:hypothetical protein